MLKGPSITAVCKLHLGVGGLWTVCTDNDRGRWGGEGRCRPASSARALVRLMGPGVLAGTY